MTSPPLAQVGMTTVENLLRVARSDSGASVAFAAFHAGGRPPQTVSVPEPGATDGLTTEDLGELVRQASADPEFLHARVFVRGVQLGRPLTLAVAPLRDGVDRSMIGVVAEPGHRFEPAQLAVLERLAERLLRHLQVVRQLNGGTAGDSAGAASAGSTTRWSDTDTADAEPADAEPADAEPADAEPADAEPADAEPSWAEPRGTETSRNGLSEGEPQGTAPAAAPAPPVQAVPPWPAPPVPETAEARVPPAWAPGAGDLGEPEERGPGSEAGEGARSDRQPPDRQPPDRQPPDRQPPDRTSLSTWWAEPDEYTGLPNLGQFFSRVGRLLAEGGAAGALALVVLEVPDQRTTPIAAKALQAQVRFTDAVARVDRGVLAAALVVSPPRSSQSVERRLADAVRQALAGAGDGVRSAHLLVALGDRRDVDELVREAVTRLPTR